MKKRDREGEQSLQHTGGGLKKPSHNPTTRNPCAHPSSEGGHYFRVASVVTRKEHHRGASRAWPAARMGLLGEYPFLPGARAVQNQMAWDQAVQPLHKWRAAEATRAAEGSSEGTQRALPAATQRPGRTADARQGSTGAACRAESVELACLTQNVEHKKTGFQKNGRFKRMVSLGEEG